MILDNNKDQTHCWETVCTARDHSTNTANTKYMTMISSYHLVKRCAYLLSSCRNISLLRSDSAPGGSADLDRTLLAGTSSIYRYRRDRNQLGLSVDLTPFIRLMVLLDKVNVLTTSHHYL